MSSKDQPINADLSFLENLYVHPDQLDPAWKQYFQSIDTKTPELSPNDQTGRISRLIDVYRRFGHLMAKINPINLKDFTEPSALNLEKLGFNQNELNQQFPTLGILSSTEAPLNAIIQALQQLYCNDIGFEFKDLYPELETWIQNRIESPEFLLSLNSEQRLLILNYLNRSELFETFLHTKYVGQKRFSLEGGETLIPMLAALLEKGVEEGLQEVIIGMAHRGRLNVLANILNKSYQIILAEFDEGYIPEASEGMGDVKYHKGYAAEFITSKGKKVAVTLPPNPSHLESVCPVVEGQTRAKQYIEKDEVDRHKIIPILIHGDAALCGQGVVYETLQLNQLAGYKTGGTLHFVINNQIGFTTIPRDLRSTCYCTSIARAFGMPVFHVNAEDPESCIKVTLLALEIRQKFHCDVFIDLNCYRKYGHNESDEPAFTQPQEYRVIRKKQPIRELYHDHLIADGLIDRAKVDQLETEFKQGLQAAYDKTKEKNQGSKSTEHSSKKSSPFQTVETGVPKSMLIKAAEGFSTIPSGFKLHPKIENLVKERLQAVKEDKPIDWGLAETLAYATLLQEGTSVRLSGQDCGRGTFSHRHALWVDQEKEQEYFALAHLQSDQGRFEAINSSLSEMGVLGFEYGYSVAFPKGLTIWEAQFGDFNNGAQIIIDQYIASAEQKWGQKSNLVLFLPHGYEGQGPEHSSARLERFLSLAADDNIVIANPTTPAQFFHLLRRQMKWDLIKPLVILTPKGLLRYPACTSRLEEFVKGSFETVLDDPSQPKEVTKLIFCSGRIYYDLIAYREKMGLKHQAIIRIEQLYPLDEEKIKRLVEKYPDAKERIWAQEEPQNMGGWTYINPYLKVNYVGRKPSATPATGSHYYHEQENENILKQVFGK